MKLFRLALRRHKISPEAAASSGGLLRLEARFSNPVTVDRMLVQRLGLSDRTAGTLLNSAIAVKILSEALAHFGLDKPVITLDHRIEKLRAFYGFGSKLQQLLGFLQLSDCHGQDNLISRGVIKRSAYYKHIKDLRRAGALIYTTYHSSLPALSIR